MFTKTTTNPTAISALTFAQITVTLFVTFVLALSIICLGTEQLPLSIRAVYALGAAIFCAVVICKGTCTKSDAIEAAIAFSICSILAAAGLWAFL